MKLVTVNIEERRHLSEIETFLNESQADVICLQEVMEQDAPVFATRLGMKYVFAPMKYLLQNKATADRKGIAILTRGSIVETDTIYYSSFLPGPEMKLDAKLIVASHCALLYLNTEIEGTHYSVATTHFMWAPGGDTAPAQFEALERLMVTLDRYPELILTGDFNCPRGKAIFDVLAERYQDNIPADVTTTIDGALHRSGDLQLVVDGLFTTQHYIASDVTIQTGVSDHCAIVGHIVKE